MLALADLDLQNLKDVVVFLHICSDQGALVIEKIIRESRNFDKLMIFYSHQKDVVLILLLFL